MEMKSIKIDNKITEKITRPVPAYLIQERDAGRGKKLSYLSGSTIIDMLNDAFGYAWSWEVKREWKEESIPFFNTYAANKTETYNGKQGAWDAQAPVAHVLGTLTVYLETEKGIVEVKKDGFGSKAVIGKQNEQDSIFKAAGTDALKKAASLFGVGLELYRNEEEKYYFAEINYVDPWTDEMKAAHEKELQYLEDYKAQYGVSEEDFSTFVYQVTETDAVITPDNIGVVVKYIEDALAQQ